MGTDTPARRSESRTPIRIRFWVQLVLAVTFTVLFIATLFDPTWIEQVFDADPDGGNGSDEWLIVVVFGVAALSMFAFAGREWRRRNLAPQRA